MPLLILLAVLGIGGTSAMVLLRKSMNSKASCIGEGIAAIGSNGEGCADIAALPPPPPPAPPAAAPPAAAPPAPASSPAPTNADQAIQKLFADERANLERIYATRGFFKGTALGASAYKAADEYRATLDFAEKRLREAKTPEEANRILASVDASRKNLAVWEKVGVNSAQFGTNAYNVSKFVGGMIPGVSVVVAGAEVVEAGAAAAKGDTRGAAEHAVAAGVGVIPFGRVLRGSVKGAVVGAAVGVGASTAISATAQKQDNPPATGL